MTGQGGSEAWKKTVLRSMPLPAWLSQDGPDSDVAVSSRVRLARSLMGHKFCRTASESELLAVQSVLEKAALACAEGFTVHRRLSEAERDYLLGCRMISPEFRHREASRSLLLSADRIVSLMINEEDHLRLQVLSPGLSVEDSQARASQVLACLSERASFASHPRWGWLTASPVNAGEAVRRSVLVHLPALAHRGQMERATAALGAMGAYVRGVFGEASRPVGHFCQVSMTRGDMASFRGACRWLIEAEREARGQVGSAETAALAASAKRSLIASQEISSGEAIKALSTLRWERAMEGDLARVRQVDEWIASIELQGAADAKTAGRYRASGLRTKIEQSEREKAERSNSATGPSRGS